MSGSWRPPADAWSRRDFMRNGFASVALLCALPVASRGGPAARHLRGHAGAGAVAVRAVPARPAADPRAPAGPAHAHAATSTTSRSRRAWPTSCPASRRRSTATTASIPGPTIRARSAREVVVRQRNALAFESNVHLHGGSVPPGHDGHPMDVIQPARELRLPLPERSGRGDALVPRPRARADVAHPVLRAGRDVRARGRPRAGARPADRRLRRADRHRRPPVQPRRLVPLPGEHRRRLPGDTILVNGAVSPRMRVQRRKYRLRLLNASNSRTYKLRLGRGRRMTQIAGDGGLLARPVGRRGLPLHRPSASTS